MAIRLSLKCGLLWYTVIIRKSLGLDGKEVALRRVISRARPTINLPCISPESSVTCNGQYRRHLMKAQPSFQDVEMAKGKHMSNMLTIEAMFSTFKRTDSHTVRCKPT